MFRHFKSSALVAGGLCGLACSWSRFDDIKNDAPVVILDQPDELHFGFGQSVAVAAQGTSVVALVTGSAPLSNGASFDLGRDESPATDASSKSYCESTAANRTCSLAQRPAGLGRAQTPGGEKRLCFVLGFGQSADVSGLVARCDDGFEYGLSTPAGVDLPVEAPNLLISEGKAVPALSLATDADEAPSLLAASATLRKAWFYPPLSVEPTELTPSRTPGAGYGRSLAVARIPGGHVFALGDPENGEVWLFRNQGTTTEALGCLADAGARTLARGLAAGPLDAEAGDELVISDESNIRVISGAALATAAPSALVDCSFDWLPSGAVLGTAPCTEHANTSGCGSSKFGAALTVLDLAGDGQSEVAVGAPDMTVRGKSRAGAVLIYALSSGELRNVDTRLLSSAEVDDHFGATLATASLAHRDVLVAGAPGRSDAAVSYCSSLVPSGKSSRCE